MGPNSSEAWTYEIRIRQEEADPLSSNVMVIPLDGMQEPFWATTEDICPNGIFVSARRGVSIDTPVLLKLVPHGTTGATAVAAAVGELRLRASVVHRIEGVGFGCRFEHLTPATSSALSRLLAARRPLARATVTRPPGARREVARATPAARLRRA